MAEVVAKAHRAWLAIPGKRGQPHQDSKFRRVQPAYDYAVPGFERGWMDRYRENWGLLREAAVGGGEAA